MSSLIDILILTAIQTVKDYFCLVVRETRPFYFIYTFKKSLFRIILNKKSSFTIIKCFLLLALYQTCAIFDKNTIVQLLVTSTSNNE